MNYKKSSNNNRDALFGGIGSNKASTSRSRGINNSTGGNTNTNTNSASGYRRKNDGSTSSAIPSLSGPAREVKVKEAKEFQEKANQCMERGFFKKADPVAACTYYKRAADAYKAVGDLVSEQYMRTSSGDTNMMVGAYASAAGDYTRAAEILLVLNNNNNSNNNTESDNEQQKQQFARRDASNLHKKASEAWKQMNETSKSAASMVAAALALNSGAAERGTKLSKEALAGLEEAIEAHVPDPLNPYSRYRQTGHSAFIEEDSDETPETCSAETLDFAKNHIVSRAYSYEPVQEVVYMLVEYGEYASALYAAGAATALLEYDGVSTLTLARAYVTETIITLAMGDPILAEDQFLNRHVQKTSYLSSRECQLAEELFRAVKNRDVDALEEVRSITGPNKAALANLAHECLRKLVQEIRVTGVARKLQSGHPSDNTSGNGGGTAAAATAEPRSLNELLKMKTGYEQEINTGATLNAHELANELDNLDFEANLDDDDDDDNDNGFGEDDDLAGLEDDDIDLR